MNSNLVPYEGWNPEEYIEELKDGSGELFLFWDDDDTDDHIYYLAKSSKKNLPKVAMKNLLTEFLLCAVTGMVMI